MAASKPDYEVVVIGGGPGGLVSSLYLGRYRRKTLLINHGKPRASWIPKTHNLFGYYKGISGQSLLNRLKRQVGSLGVEHLKSNAVVQVKGKTFRIETNQGELSAAKVILATGMEDFQPNIPNIRSLRKAGLLRYCPICDAFEYRNKNIFILARDDEGAKKSLFLNHYTKRLTLIVPEEFQLSSHRKRQLWNLGVPVLRGRLEAIEPGPGGKTLLVCIDGKIPEPFDVGYVELGAKVRDEAFSHLKRVARLKNGFLTTTLEQRLTLPGLFAVGDCVNVLGQISVAAGQAAVAATSAHNDLLYGR